MQGLLLFGAIHFAAKAFTGNFLQDVEGDYELQDWVRDVAEEGFGWQDGNKRGVPERLDSVEKLVSTAMESASSRAIGVQ